MEYVNLSGAYEGSYGPDNRIGTVKEMEVGRLKTEALRAHLLSPVSHLRPYQIANSRWQKQDGSEVAPISVSHLLGSFLLK